MQLNVFNTDSRKSGFRLQYMEVYNWGTFDGHIHTIRPLGETSLLTGANGSGKTTFVDALLTLLVPEKKYRFYNQSSGSEKKGDRTEETYVLGSYGDVGGDGAAARTMHLRENREEAYSILLASFANEAEQTVTLFQVRWFANGELRKLFAIAHKALQIEEDFRPFDLGGAWRRTLDAKYNNGPRKAVEWFDTASRYAQRLVEVLGMQSMQALSLFNQTVGIKVLGNLDEFIRMHMLEPHPMEEQFAELKGHLGTLLDARRNIEKAEAQMALLQPLAGSYQSYERHRQELASAKEEVGTALIWYRYTQHLLVQGALEAAGAAVTDLERQVAAAEAATRELIEKERQALNDLEHNRAGQRLQQLAKELDGRRSDLAATEYNITTFRGWCAALQLPETEVLTEAAYKSILNETGKEKRRLETALRLNEEDEFEAKTTYIQGLKKKEELEGELNTLVQNRNNIPGYLTQIRRDICAALKAGIDELPFAGELMQVAAESAEWEPALEKLLHGFALRLLVPERYYKKVNRYVNNTHLGGKLVYHQVTDVAMYLQGDPGTVVERLEFHPDHPLSGWLEQQIIRHFDLVCLDDERKLEQHDRAITRNSLIKMRDRHEKDDRPARNERSGYVLGWNNERKKEALLARRDELNGQIAEAGEAIERSKRKSARLKAKAAAIGQIEQHGGYTLLDLAKVQKSIASLEAEVTALKQDNDQLQLMTAGLEEIRRQLEGERRRQTTLIGQMAVHRAEAERLQARAGELGDLVRHITGPDKDLLLRFQQQYAADLSDVSVDRIDTVYAQVKERLQERQERLQAGLRQDELQLVRGIRSIKSPSLELQQQFPDWSGDVAGLPEDPAYAGEYLEWLQQLEADNLPRYKKDFERYLHETMVYKIGELHETLESRERAITQSIRRLNDSLSGLNFNRLPNTYIQLGKRPVTDTAIKEFRGRLLHALPQAASWQQSSFEEKAAHFRDHIQPLIQRLEESEAYRSRMLDVRNWSEFWADEKYALTHETKKTYRQMGQLSGGEKAQLTYTLLCSAIAYQFGITRDEGSHKNLRFIAVDESFSNQDEEKATYLMELCRQLHLQLLIVTPSDKIQIVQDFIAHVHLVQRVNNRNSVLYNMTIRELQEQIHEARGASVLT